MDSSHSLLAAEGCGRDSALSLVSGRRARLCAGAFEQNYFTQGL